MERERDRGQVEVVEEHGEVVVEAARRVEREGERPAGDALDARSGRAVGRAV